MQIDLHCRTKSCILIEPRYILHRNELNLKKLIILLKKTKIPCKQMSNKCIAL